MKKMKKKKNLNKSIFCILTVFVLLFALAIPCFAWTSPPIYPPKDEQYDFWFTYNGNLVCFGMSENGVDYDICVDFAVIGDTNSNDWEYIPVGQNGPGAYNSRNMVNSYINTVRTSIGSSYYQNGYDEGFQDGLYEGSSDAYDEGYQDGIEFQSQQDFTKVENAFLSVPGSTWENVDNDLSLSVSTSLSTSKSDWIVEGQSGAYNQGYNDGLAEADIAETTILTIFSVPSYILSTIFNFEIFGINLYALITFLLTITIVGTVIKKII